MLPLLALGLMAGAGFLNQRAYDQRKQAGADRVAELLGAAPGPMGPPTEDGVMGASPGRGLLADPANTENQARFVQGLLTLPRAQQEQALRAYGDMFGRIQQQNQFTSQEGRLGQQWKDDQARQAHQFGLTFGEMQKQHGIQNDQWAQSFGAQRFDAAQRRALERARFGLEQQRVNQAGGTGAPELPKGWMYTQSAAGTVAMPIPGTKDYADVTKTEQSLNSAITNIGNFLDTYAGKQTGPTGVRVGGAGTTLSGETAGKLSSQRAKIIADVAVLRDMGVLQAGELENIEKQLADPTSAWSYGRTTAGTTKAYDELQKQFKDRLKAHRDANPWLLPPPPPGAVTDGPNPTPKPGNQRPSPGPGASGSAPPVGGNPGARPPARGLMEVLGILATGGR